MTDPQNPTPPSGDQSAPPPAPEPPAAAPAYGAPAPGQPGAAPAYEAPAYAAPGYATEGYGAPQAPVPGKTMGIVAFILSFFVQLIALILGIIALVQSRKAGQKNGFALAAIIISVVLGLVWIVLTIVFFSLILSGAGDLTSQIQACLDNGGVGTVEFAGQQFSCAEILEDAGY